jgi:DNA-binding IclR family transcriptional regulator
MRVLGAVASFERAGESGDRNQLCERADMDADTVYRCLQRLLEVGLVRDEIASGRLVVGRPRSRYSLTERAAKALATLSA